MKNILIAAIAILAISFTSCKKEEVVQPCYEPCQLIVGRTTIPQQFSDDIVYTLDIKDKCTGIVKTINVAHRKVSAHHTIMFRVGGEFCPY